MQTMSPRRRVTTTRPGPRPKRILLVGATGSAGKAAAAALASTMHDVVAFVRPDADIEGIPAKVQLRFGTVTNHYLLERDCFQGDHFDVLVSCLASRTGEPDDAWAIDHDANLNVLKGALDVGVSHVVHLSAICVQKPQLEFQRAKLAYEEELKNSGVTWSIVRPTAFFKSLGGQIERVKKGKSFVVFGDGTLTACKPISDRDLGAFIASCVDDPKKRYAELPIGGPGPALTPRDMGNELFRLTGQKPKFKEVSLATMDRIIKLLDLGGRFFPGLKEKAQLARIGRYYGSESMLVYNRNTQAYSEADTPSFGHDTLFDYYNQVLAGEERVELREHAVF